MKRSAGDAGMDSYDMLQYAVPGAFPAEDFAAAEPASSFSSASVFTTVGIVVLSIFQWLRPSFWTRRLFKKGRTQRYTIRAEPVSRDSVGRKKVLIDQALQKQELETSPTKTPSQTIPLTPLNTFIIRGKFDETPTPQDLKQEHRFPDGSLKPLLRTPDTLPRTRLALHTPQPPQTTHTFIKRRFTPAEPTTYPQTWSDWMDDLPDAPSAPPSPSPPKKPNVDDYLDTTLEALATPSKHTTSRPDDITNDDDDDEEGFEMSQLSDECAEDFKDCLEEVIQSPEARQTALLNLRIVTPESIRVSPSGRFIRADAPATPTEREIHAQRQQHTKRELSLNRQLTNQLIKRYAIKALTEQEVPRPLLGPTTLGDKDIIKGAVRQWQESGYKQDLRLGKVGGHDLGTILPQMFGGDKAGWLNDEIINSYLSILVAHVNKAQGYTYKGRNHVEAPPAYAFSSQWYTTMEGPNPKSTVNWAKRFHVSGENFFKSKLLLFPICKGMHWRLLAVMPQERHIEYLDSLTDKKGVDPQILRNIHNFLEFILEDLYIPAEWSGNDGQRSQQQANASDCGVFTLLNGLVLLSDSELTEVVVDDGMEAARIRIATTLVKGEVTGERV